MRYLKIIIVVFSINSCFAQEIIIDYCPSFHFNSRCSIVNEDDKYKIHFEVYDSSNIIYSEYGIANRELVDELFQFLEKQTDTQKKHIVFDGIIINVILKKDDDNQLFRYSSPLKGTCEYDFFNNSIVVLESSINSRKAKKYIRRLKKYL